MSENFRSGYCAIAGIPNAGKSTLLNALLGTKLSIISAKPQTTRKRVLGIYSTKSEQIIFLDTPGIMPRPTTLHHKALLSEVSRSFDDADVILVLVEATLSPERALPKEWKKYVEIAGKKPIVLAVSKIDLFKDKKKVLPLLAEYGEMNIFSDIIPISSKKQYNLKQLVEVLHKYLPSEKAFYDTEQLSDQNERFFASELIREAIFHEFREEIPYSTEVVIMEYSEREEGKWFISADILVERDSQKSILIGKGGETLKALGARARKSIEQFVEHPIYLELHVKAKSDWRNDKNVLREMGYGV
ncbi:MAG: GTPase Era [Bacteroidota bacterium]|nr:GTPase Era [Bacteroidota bacterium]MDP4236146.1 GTPase Era [Bacteroidota bacterium]